MKILVALLALLPVSGFGIAEASTSNWTGRYSPCNHNPDLLIQHHMDLGVRISTTNPLLAQQFERAMEFWTRVLDMKWHHVDSQDCAIQLVDGTPSIFDFCACLSARSQFPDRPAFQGWIAFNPRFKLTKHEMFLDSVHEIGHLLGLPHNPSGSSVMFFEGSDKAPLLDAVDLEILAAHHQLRRRLSTSRDIRVTEPRETDGHAQGWFQAIVWHARQVFSAVTHSQIS